MDRKADVARRQFAHVLSAKLPNLGNNLPKNTFLPWTHVTNNHTLLEPVVMDVAAIGGNNDTWTVLIMIAVVMMPSMMRRMVLMMRML